MIRTAAASVIIPNWNGRALLRRCLTALERVRPVDVIVADNGSRDGSVDEVSADYPWVRVIELGANRGFAAAINAGIKVVETEYVAFLNNDVVVEETWLPELLACLDRHEDAAAATPKLLMLERPGIIDSAGDLLTQYFRGYPRGRGERDVGQYDGEVEVFAVSGAASLWRTEVFRNVGLLDEDLFFSYEDVDLCFRARLAGYSCWYAPRAVAHHAGGATSKGKAEFVYFHATRNRWSVIAKDIPADLLLRSVPRIVWGEVLTVGRAIREGEVRHVLAAYRAVSRSIPSWLQRRGEIQSARVVPSAAIQRMLTQGYPALGRRVVITLRG